MIRLRYAAGPLAVLVLTLAGCGSGDGGPGARPGSGAGSAAADEQDMNVKFAQCMREHGVNLPDPNPGQPGIRITGRKGDEAKVDAATRACQKYSPKRGMDMNDPATRDRMLKTAQCLREHGIDAPDPAPGQGLHIQVKGNEAKAQQAMTECRRLIPMPSSPRPNGG
jgi:hypothetical protein